MSIKRASLNLSIQTIVVVVIAMILLGLGLGFVRSQFKSIGETTTTIQEQVRQQILEDLRTGNKKLSFPTNEIKMGKGETKMIAIGIMNQASCEMEYNISLKHIKGEEVLALDKILLPPEGTLPVTEAIVEGIRLIAQKKSGTGLYKLEVSAKASGEGSDKSGCELGSDYKTYAYKNFYVTVS